MNVYKVQDALANKYHGSGHALAAVLNGELVDIIYLEDVLPNFDGNIKVAIDSPALGPTVRSLQVLGKVSVGMLSSWEFVEL